jgi:hypothetical protein
MTRLLHRYVDLVLPAITGDPALAEIYIRVFGMVAPPTALFAPQLLLAAAGARPNAVGALASNTPPARPLARAARS